MTWESLTPERIASLIHQVFPGTDVLSSEQIAGTHTHLSYRVQLSNLLDTVLKIYRATRDTGASRQEIQLLRMITSETGVPVPRVLSFAEHLPGQPSPASTPWALLTHVAGEPLSRVVDALEEGELESVGYDMGRYLAHIHQIPLDRFGALYDRGANDHIREKGYVLAQVGEWLDDCTHRNLLTQDIVNMLRARFEDTDLLDRRQACLVHGDFHLGHVIVQRGMTGYHVTGILDFTHAQAGGPELDLGKLFAWDLQDVPTARKGFLDGYAEAGALSPTFWGRLGLYQAYSSLGALLVAHQRGEAEEQRVHRERIVSYLQGVRGAAATQP